MTDASETAPTTFDLPPVDLGNLTMGQPAQAQAAAQTAPVFQPMADANAGVQADPNALQPLTSQNPAVAPAASPLHTPPADADAAAMAMQNHGHADPTRLAAIMSAISGETAPATGDPLNTPPVTPNIQNAVDPSIFAAMTAQTQAMTAMMERMAATSSGAAAAAAEEPQTLTALLAEPPTVDENVLARFQNNPDLQTLINHTAQQRATELMRPVLEAVDAKITELVNANGTTNTALQTMQQAVYQSTVANSAEDLQILRTPAANAALDTQDPLSGQTPRQMIAAAHAANDAGAVRRLTSVIAAKVRGTAAPVEASAAMATPKTSGVTPAPATGAEPTKQTATYEQMRANLDARYAARQISEVEYRAVQGQLLASLIQPS